MKVIIIVRTMHTRIWLFSLAAVYQFEEHTIERNCLIKKSDINVYFDSMPNIFFLAVENDGSIE